MRRARAAWQHDAGVAVAALLALLLWDACRLDLALTRWIAAPWGFPWRDSLLASRLLHDGGRALAWGALAVLAWDAWRPLAPGPSRRQRLHAVAAVLAGLVLVPLVKRFSATSCPWDLAEFGGRAAYVPHWRLGVTDGGPGHCFPSGHAVAAFAFLAVYALWRHHRPRAARWMLSAVLGLGLMFGWAQWVRGAHFASHTMWSAWLCWVLAALADGAGVRADALRRAETPRGPEASAQNQAQTFIIQPGSRWRCGR